MLVLDRGVYEAIHLTIPGILNPVVITIVEISKFKVRLGIAADRDIEIMRAELINQPKRKAS